MNSPKNRSHRPAASRGFTLIELLVVVLVIGTLAGFAVPYYLKTVEISKANAGAALANEVATAARMYAVDHGIHLSGALTGACSGTSANCSITGAHGACDLIYCGYLSQQDWDTNPYSAEAANNASCGLTCPGGSYVACTARQGAASAPYSGWGYAVDAAGATYACGGAELPADMAPAQVAAVAGVAFGGSGPINTNPPGAVLGQGNTGNN